MSITSQLQIVPTKSPQEVLLAAGGNHHGLIQVPWFARAVYTEAGRPVYTEEEVEMYPLDLKMKPRPVEDSVGAFISRPTTEEDEDDGLDTTAARDLSSRLKPSSAAEDGLPSDPRLWSREEVCRWVLWTCSAHNLPAPNTDRFLMNGKAVCLMSLNMFISRVPLGGKLLYRDFQIRLGRALYR
jgi:hypothetical protein